MMRKHNHLFAIRLIYRLLYKIKTLVMQCIVMFRGKTQTVVLDLVEVIQVSFNLPLILNTNLAPQGTWYMVHGTWYPVLGTRY